MRIIVTFSTKMQQESFSGFVSVKTNLWESFLRTRQAPVQLQAMKDLPAEGFQELLKRQRQCSYRSLDPWCWWLPPFPFQIIFDGGVLPKLMRFFRVSFTLVSETDQSFCFEGNTSSPSAWTMFTMLRSSYTSKEAPAIVWWFCWSQMRPRAKMEAWIYCPQIII